jgi:oligoribonuclease (3'-5' exoribonuclease)
MNDAKMCMMIRVAADRLWLMNLVRAVEEKIQENRRFAIPSLSLHFPQISRSLLHEIVFDELRFRKLCSRWVPKVLADEHKMKQAT